MTGRHTKERTLTAAIIFFIFGILYFMPWFPLPHKICIPLFSLGLFAIGILPWQLCAALLFSGLGDLSGSFKAGSPADIAKLAFIGQMAFFALAHVFYIVYFLCRGWKNKRKVTKGDGLYLGAVMVICIIIIHSALVLIVPCVTDRILNIGVTAYACIITVMLFTALMQKDWIFGIGALLFVVSDYSLAWNMFVGAIPGEKYIIMVTYYLAQAIIAGRAAWIAFHPAVSTPEKKNKKNK